MKTKKLLSLIMLIVAFTLSAQEPPKINIEELHNQKWAYLVEKAKLTQSEATNVKPLFLEYEKNIWKTIDGNKDVFKAFFDKKDDLTEADYNQMNERFVNTEIHKAQLMKSYYSKLKKYLSAEKIFKYFKAERSYRKDLMDNWQGKHRGPKK